MIKLKFKSLLPLLLLIIASCNSSNKKVLSKQPSYEEAAIEYLYKSLSETNEKVGELCLPTLRNNILLESNVWMTDLYLCFKYNEDTTMINLSSKEIKGERVPNEVNKYIPINKVYKDSKICTNKNNIRTVRFKSATYLNGKVYVEIVLTSRIENAGESICFEFKENDFTVLNSCVSTWVV